MKEAAQVAYEALVTALQHPMLRWDEMKEMDRACWRAVVKAVNEFGRGEPGFVHERLARIEDVQIQILEVVNKMATTQDQLDTELAAVETEVSQLVSTVNTALTDLLAKIAANPTAPVADFTAEFDALQSLYAQLTALQATAAADDPGALAAAAPVATS